MSILLQDILDVKSLDSRYWPFIIEDCYFFTISTLPKEFLILVRGEKQLNDWISTIISSRNYIVAELKRVPQSLDSMRNYSEEKFGETFKQLISYPLDWKLGDRMILNGRCYCGRLLFERLTEYELDSSSHLFPIQLLERCLSLILNLAISFVNGESGPSAGLSGSVGRGTQRNQWLEFLTLISYLPCIDILSYNFSENELTCILINLYHVMILHSFIVAGPPSTLLRWPSFFNSYSYEAYGRISFIFFFLTFSSGDIFSLSELEHCIIKSGLEAPNNLIAQVLIPQSTYDFGLKRKDYRLLWALNCGSVSMPSTIPIFTPTKCDEQLDRMMR
jgi:hypothetical protein